MIDEETKKDLELMQMQMQLAAQNAFDKFTAEYLEENKVITDQQIRNYIAEAKTNNFTWAT